MRTKVNQWLKEYSVLKEVMFFFLLLDHPFQLRFADLGKDVILKLVESLGGDRVAVRHIYKSFAINGNLIPEEIFELFPDTPVKLFKDVLEALQLYDLVELLEKPQKPPPVRTLRPALPLHDIEKLRKSTDSRPTTYHSNVAVLIVTDEKSHHTKAFERFFKGFSSKSDVTVLEWKEVSSQLAPQRGIRISPPPEEARKQGETNEKAVLAVIERWIHNQGW